MLNDIKVFGYNQIKEIIVSRVERRYQETTLPGKTINLFTERGQEFALKQRGDLGKLVAKLWGKRIVLVGALHKREVVSTVGCQAKEEVSNRIWLPIPKGSVSISEKSSSPAIINRTLLGGTVDIFNSTQLVKNFDRRQATQSTQ